MHDFFDLRQFLSGVQIPPSIRAVPECKAPEALALNYRDILECRLRLVANTAPASGRRFIILHRWAQPVPAARRNVASHRAIRAKKTAGRETRPAITAPKEQCPDQSRTPFPPKPDIVPSQVCTAEYGARAEIFQKK